MDNHSLSGEHMDVEAVSDVSQLIADTSGRQQSPARGLKRAVLTSSAVVVLLFAGVAVGLAVSNAHAPKVWAHADASIEEVDTSLVTNVKKFRETMESAEIVESMRMNEGNAINPLLPLTELGFTEPELKGLRKAFDDFDENRDGNVTATELEQKLKDKLGLDIDRADINKMIREADLHGNNDGMIQFSGFANVMKRAHEQGFKLEQRVFQFFDTNGDKEVDIEEAWGRQKEFQSGGDDQMKKTDVAQVIQAVDMNGDGQLSNVEWAVMAE